VSQYNLFGVSISYKSFQERFNLFKVKVLKTIDEIEKEVIDSLSDDGFLTYGWFKTLEASKPFKIIPKYFVVYEEAKIIAIAPCFIQYSAQYFTLEDLLFLLKRLRKVHNHLGFFKPPLICYSPSSFHSIILLKKDFNARLILDLILKKIDEVCREQRILFSSFLFVSEFDKLLIKNLPNFGYSKIALSRTAYLDIKWSSFDDYVANQPRRIRKRIRREIKKNREFGVIIEQNDDFHSLSPILSDLYSNLFLKYKGKKSPLHPLFFEKLNEYAKSNARVFTAKKNGKIIGFSLCLRHKKTLDSYIVGFDYNYLTRTDYTYFNVSKYALIKAAIEEGIEKIHFRPATLTAKLGRGCKLERIYTFIKCQNRLLNLILNPYIKYRYVDIVKHR